MRAAELVRDLWRAIRNRCPVDGEVHCEHYDYTSGYVTFYRCCKCKLRSSMWMET